MAQTFEESGRQRGLINSELTNRNVCDNHILHILGLSNERMIDYSRE